MKKAIFASIIMLATLTACNNSEGSINNPEDQKGAVFQSKAAARGGEELPSLSPEEEKAVIEEAIETLKSDQESELNGNGSTDRARILCHTNYSSPSGHACVYNSSGYLVTVTWDYVRDLYNVGEMMGLDPDSGHYVYHGTVTPRCNC